MNPVFNHWFQNVKIYIYPPPFLFCFKALLCWILFLWTWIDWNFFFFFQNWVRWMRLAVSVSKQKSGQSLQTWILVFFVCFFLLLFWFSFFFSIQNFGYTHKKEILREKKNSEKLSENRSWRKIRTHFQSLNVVNKEKKFFFLYIFKESASWGHEDRERFF